MAGEAGAGEETEGEVAEAGEQGKRGVGDGLGAPNSRSIYHTCTPICAPSSTVFYPSNSPLAHPCPTDVAGGFRRGLRRRGGEEQAGFGGEEDFEEGAGAADGLSGLGGVAVS
jgi:hypothetical protein